MTFLSQLDWRFAAKDFDTSKPVHEQDIAKILHAVHLAPTSFGLQPFHVVTVSDPDLKKNIRKHAWDQPQIENASHVLVFCTRTDTDVKRIEQLIGIMSGGSLEAREKLAPYEGIMHTSLGTRTPEELKAWGDRQTYIALGFAMAACAELAIDSCPIEGFLPEEVDKILKLSPHIRSTVMLPVGYRTADPTQPKVRFPAEELFTFKE